MAEAAAGVLQAGDDPELSAAELDCTALAALALKDGDGDGEEGHGEAPGGTQEQRKHEDKEAGEGKKSADAAGVTTRALDIRRLVALDDAEAGDEVREHVSTLVHLSPDEQANLSAQMLKAREEARRQQAILRDEEVARGMQMEQDSARLEPIIHGVLAHLAPDQEKSRRQDGLVLRLERFVKGLYGAQATLEVFGSTVCQHAGKSSDLDVTLTPAFSHRLNLEEKKKVIRAVSKGLRGIGMHAQPILHARVPILQINASGVAVDLSVENELPVFKSRLLHEYTLLDHRFAQLVLLVKAWAKARQISSAQHGTFNSFGLSLLVLHYLQQLEPPVLPFLNRRDQGANRQPLHVDAPQRLAQCHADLVPTHRGARTTLGGEKIDVIHYTRDQLRDWRSQNSTRLVILLHGFFLYFARKFPWDSHVVTVTSPGPVAKSSVSVRSVNTGVIIQDPLDEHDNVARNIGRKTKMAVMHEFERAYSLDFGALLHEIRSAANSEAPAATRKRGPAAETRGGVGGDVVARATVEGEHMLQQETQEENMLTAADGSTRASAQRELAEKLAGCATLGDVLLVVESVPVGWWLSDTPNMERPQSIDLSMMLLDLYLDKQMAKQAHLRTCMQARMHATKPKCDPLSDPSPPRLTHTGGGAARDRVKSVAAAGIRAGRVRGGIEGCAVTAVGDACRTQAAGCTRHL